MIADIIRLLQKDKFYNVSQQVEIAKGRYQYVDTWAKCRAQIVRMFKYISDGKKV
jgi:hypothetical protein